MDYPRPNDFFDTNPERLREIRDEVKKWCKSYYRTNSWFEEKKTKNRRWKNGNRIYSNAKRFTT